MQKICLIQTSVASLSEAKRFSNAMIQSRLCACVQITGSGLSIYRWQGEIEQTEEYYLSIKTSLAKKDSVVAWLQQHHAYDLPEITWLLCESDEVYADWVHAAVVQT